MMRSLLEDKRLILVLAALALVALTVLATSLNRIPFQPGQQFTQDQGDRAQADLARGVLSIWVETPWWEQLIVWVLLAILVFLSAYLLTPEMRKRLIRRFIRMALTFWGIFYIFTNYGHLIPALNVEPEEIAPVQNSHGPQTAPAVFVPSEISSTFSYVISFAFALFVFIVMWAVYRGWQKLNTRTNRKPLDEIARIARTSLIDLSAGKDSSDVIVSCYLRMSDVVAVRRGLQRAAAMTPHEFALRLEQAGLPRDAVRRLTRLFEVVRYGDRTSSPQEVNEAVTCLTTILHYCGEPV